MKARIWLKQYLTLNFVVLLLIVKELGGPYFYLSRNLTKKAVTILTHSFGDFMSVIHHWIVLSLSSSFVYPAVQTVLKISVIRVVLFSWFPWMHGVAIIKLWFGKVIQWSSLFSLPVEERRHFKLCLSTLIILRHFTLLWCNICAKNGYCCSQTQKKWLFSISCYNYL